MRMAEPRSPWEEGLGWAMAERSALRLGASHGGVERWCKALRAGRPALRALAESKRAVAPRRFIGETGPAETSFMEH